LLKKGANFTQTNNQGLTALRFAERRKASKARDLLLNPPPVEGTSDGRDKAPLPAWLAKDDWVCTTFDAFMVNFYSNKSSDNKTSQPDGENFQERVDWLPRIKPLNRVIYEDGPKKIFEEAQKTAVRWNPLETLQQTLRMMLSLMGIAKPRNIILHLFSLGFIFLPIM
jgi:hypothetical protein